MNKSKLKELYENVSKHSSYQILPDILLDLVDENELNIKSRFEKERLEYIKSNIEISNQTVVDVGGNSGYFTFEMLSAGAKRVKYFEGNKAHADFVQLAAGILNADVEVSNAYLQFDNSSDLTKSDIVLLLNVVHHFGDDFGDSELAKTEAKLEMKNCLNYFADKTHIMVFQMGYCWKGDTSKLLFQGGSKQEMISFVENAAEGFWKIKSIGIAEEIDGRTTYKNLDSTNIKRDDSLGEFRNRPLFILESLKT